MTTIYRLIASETDLELGHVYHDDSHQYCWDRADRTDAGMLYPTAKEALEALGERFAHVPVHVVNG